jgi:hypothetical protein
MSAFGGKADIARSIGLIRVKRRRYISVVGISTVVVVAGLLGAGTLVVSQSRVPPQAIASSVTRTPELMEPRVTLAGGGHIQPAS